MYLVQWTTAPLRENVVVVIVFCIVVTGGGFGFGSLQRFFFVHEIDKPGRQSVRRRRWRRWRWGRRRRFLLGRPHFLPGQRLGRQAAVFAGHGHQLLVQAHVIADGRARRELPLQLHERLQNPVQHAVILHIICRVVDERGGTLGHHRGHAAVGVVRFRFTVVNEPKMIRSHIKT